MGNAELKSIMGSRALPLAVSRGSPQIGGKVLEGESILAFRRAKERQIRPLYIL